MRYVEIRPVHEDECQEMTAHQTETQILADGSLFVVFYAAKNIHSMALENRSLLRVPQNIKKQQCNRKANNTRRTKYYP
jgi:hypothetical protein